MTSERAKEIVARIDLAAKRTVGESPTVRYAHHLDHAFIGTALPDIAELCLAGAEVIAIEAYLDEQSDE